MKTLVSSDNFLKTKNSLLPRLLNLFYISKSQHNSQNSGSGEMIFNWFPYFYYKNPLNLLFSGDQFLYEFLVKYPQRKKMSEYKLQLKEQKKLSLFYGSLSKKQLQKYFLESSSAQGEFSKKFIGLLERRLDVILYRSQFVKNIATARQLIIHKKVLVNQKITSIPSYLATPGDVISVTESAKPRIKSSLRTVLKSQNITLSPPPMNLKDWKFKSKFISKKQIQLLTSLIMRKIHIRAEVQQYSNPFSVKTQESPYLYFHIYKLSALPNSYVFKSDISKKIILQTLSNLNFDDVSKQVFLLTLEKNLSKRFSKHTILSNLNVFGMKPLHLESSYKLFTTIFLYSPQRVYYPFALDFDLLKRANHKK
nr:ribosomal protein S4 [Chlorella desiccata (nom. nud.)]